jgi:hypothetical protein
MANNHVKLLESSLRNVLASAVAARKRLTAAREEHGLADPQMFFTRAEVDELLAEERAERRAIVRAFTGANNPNAPPNAFVASKQTAEQRAQISWITTLARAEEILDERQRKQAAKEAAAAIHRAAAKARPRK